MRLQYVALLAAGVMACAGCGHAGPPQVKGTVTINGIPAKKGEIRLVPVDGVGPVASGAIDDGAFALRAPVGAKRVEIQAFEQTGVKPLDASMPGSASVPVLKPLLPAKFNSASTLTLQVDADLDHNFELAIP